MDSETIHEVTDGQCSSNDEAVGNQFLQNYTSNFFKLVSKGHYENLEIKLPLYMNLVEVEKKNKDNVLHICVKNNFFTTFNKILSTNHPAAYLSLLQANLDGDTPLDLLKDHKIFHTLIQANECLNKNQKIKDFVESKLLSYVPGYQTVVDTSASILGKTMEFQNKNKTGPGF